MRRKKTGEPVHEDPQVLLSYRSLLSPRSRTEAVMLGPVESHAQWLRLLPRLPLG